MTEFLIRLEQLAGANVVAIIQEEYGGCTLYLPMPKPWPPQRSGLENLRHAVHTMEAIRNLGSIALHDVDRALALFKQAQARDGGAA